MSTEDLREDFKENEVVDTDDDTPTTNFRRSLGSLSSELPQISNLGKHVSYSVPPISSITESSTHLENDEHKTILLSLTQRKMRTFGEVKTYLQNNLPYVSKSEFLSILYDIILLFINIAFVLYNVITLNKSHSKSDLSHVKLSKQTFFNVKRLCD